MRQVSLFCGFSQSFVLNLTKKTGHPTWRCLRMPRHLPLSSGSEYNVLFYYSITDRKANSERRTTTSLRYYIAFAAEKLEKMGPKNWIVSTYYGFLLAYMSHKTTHNNKHLRKLRGVPERTDPPLLLGWEKNEWHWSTAVYKMDSLSC